MGFYPGPEDSLMPPSEDNPKGYYENLPIVNLHDRLLIALDRAWDDNRTLPEGWTTGVPYAQAKKRLRGILRKLADTGGDVVVKDPRIARLLPLWRDACYAEGLMLRALVVDRDLQSVSASLQKRDGWDANRAWEFVCQQEGYLREWESRGESVRFPDFLAAPWLDFLGAVRRLVHHEIRYDPRALGAFFDPELVHHG
jgi:hypothetical protein